MKSITLIIPCFNEQEAIPVFYREVKKVLAGMNYSCEILFVNDGSKDNTLAVIKMLAEKDPAVKYLSFSRNFGKEAAMYAGFCNADSDYTAVMDADMQDPPALLPKMIDILETGEYDSVATRRVDRAGEPPVRSFFARRFYRIVNAISDVEIVDGARDFRLMKREMVDAIVAMGEYNRFSKGIFAWVGFKTKWVEYENVERAHGETKWSFWGLFRYALDGMLSFSSIPLAVTSFMGVLFCIVAFVMLLFVWVRALIFGDPTSGWPSLVCIILLASGVQLLCLGVLGQYLSKTYMEVKHRPIYVVKEEE